ncbi:ABC transporter permease [Coralloluteibacterium stylophorae]|uniref:Transport permease protein n=1 Tax=Coralloluteibacterium stylophorae TaxID=1776034 RepID=A0A8J8AWA5_9GAMM|nr:ABC transporter permease [Coralloluteibacterium stylophorae]MBS7458257.1 ABC transporter permease [Coralloluteibacterium stylophorae]
MSTPAPDATAARLRAAFAAPAVEARPRAVANTVTFAWRALLKIKHTPEQLFDVVVTPIMFTVLFTYLFGGALAGSTAAYLQFLLPGMLVQTVMFTTIYTGFTLNTDLSRGVYDRFRSMPIWKPAPLVGAMLGDQLRYTLSGLIVIVIGLLMGFRPGAGLAGVVASLLLLDVFAFGTSWIFTAVALWVRTPSTVMTLSWLVLMPLTFASNVFVDPATMPGWLQAVVAVNPVALLVTAIRGVIHGDPDAGAIGLALIAPALVTAAFAPLAMRLYRRER